MIHVKLFLKRDIGASGQQARKVLLAAPQKMLGYTRVQEHEIADCKASLIRSRELVYSARVYYSNSVVLVHTSVDTNYHEHNRSLV